MKYRSIVLSVAILSILCACSRGAFIIDGNSRVTVSVGIDDPVVGTALEIFSGDISNVLSATCSEAGRDAQILVVSADDPAFASDPDVASVAGLHEAFLMKVLPSGQLLIAGSDGHGAAYALMELSRMLGVSPWEWWADCSPCVKSQFVLKKDFKVTHAPSVAYRGIFINDEDFAFIPWVTGNLEPTDIPGRIGPQTHSRIFELLLRLRANTFWPAMHGCSVPFFLTEEIFTPHLKIKDYVKANAPFYKHFNLEQFNEYLSLFDMDNQNDYLAMSAVSSQKDACWEYLKLVMSEDFQNQVYIKPIADTFPTNKASMENMIRYSSEPQYDEGHPTLKKGDSGEEVKDRLRDAMEMATDERSRDAIRKAMEMVK